MNVFGVTNPMSGKMQFPLGLGSLKSQIRITDTDVECPVIGCGQTVKRQRSSFHARVEFQCPEHGLYISPSTFAYPNDTDNLLWKDEESLDLLKGILKVKRECRMARERSEDALTWNTFRFLDKAKLLAPFLSQLCGRGINQGHSYYWSFDPKTQSTWASLREARSAFGELSQRGSEPDLIVETDQALFFIEAKLTAGHQTKPANSKVAQGYTSGCNGIYQQLFQADFDTVAVQKAKYELMRFWLIGSQIGLELNLPFFLVTVGRSVQSQSIQSEFGDLIIQNSERCFRSTSWEDIYDFVDESGQEQIPEASLYLDYMKNKSIGYDPRGCLQAAFEIK